jgi:hypothetical protein
MHWLQKAQNWCFKFESEWQKAKSNTEFWDFAAKSMSTKKWSEEFVLAEVI